MRRIRVDGGTDEVDHVERASGPDPGSSGAGGSRRRRTREGEVAPLGDSIVRGEMARALAALFASGGVARARRQPRALCIALLDLDGLKALNDQHGHEAGDRAIAVAATRWRGLIRDGDLLARQGGDEFALMLPDCSSDGAETLLDRIRQSATGLSVSVGLACMGADETAQSIMARADVALYEAKGRGRDQVVCAPCHIGAIPDDADGGMAAEAERVAQPHASCPPAGRRPASALVV